MPMPTLMLVLVLVLMPMLTLKLVLVLVLMLMLMLMSRMSMIIMVIMDDADLIIHTGDSKIGHEVLLHSAAHLMAQAVKKFWPTSQMTIGPVIENRFYYDFDIEGTFSDEDLLKIEEEMHNIANENHDVSREDLSRDEAIKLFSKLNENYKVEIINEIDESDRITAYKQGDFIDLCRGPHTPST